MAHDFQHRVIAANGIRQHFVTAGTGYPMVLLHGWPKTWYEWRRLIPPLAEHFTVIVPDLRGMGDTEKPAAGYDMRTVATDIYELVRALGHQQPILVGQDWGGLAARRYALDHPQDVDRLVIVDVGPHEQILTSLDPPRMLGSWHYFFNAQPDLPELLVQGREEPFLRYFFRYKTYRPDFFSEEELRVYVRALSQPGGLRGGFSYYRAMFAENRRLDAADPGRKIEVPMLVVWGTTGSVGAMFPVLEMWQREATNVRGHRIEECGHYIAEEQPEKLAQAILEFCADRM